VTAPKKYPRERWREGLPRVCMNPRVKYAAVDWEKFVSALRLRRLRGAGVDIRFRRQ